MHSRILSKTIEKAIKTFPAIVVTGPRQSGKTTLLKMLFSKTHKYVSLEDPDVRINAKDDPRGFLSQFKPPVIIDEVQYFPELLSYIKTMIDKDRKPGQWLFTGSQNFKLMQGTSESLAGRAAILSLLPFSFSEVINNSKKVKDISVWLNNLSLKTVSSSNADISSLILRGSYPEISLNKKIDRQLWCSSYISTYLERDVRNISSVGDLSQFERFLKLCAIRTGQILNISEMSRDIGVSVTTAKRWLSILEAGYQIYLLYPYYKNLGKSIIKSPKIYFTDTALATYLLGINDKSTLLNGPSFGYLFETMIVIDFLKRFHGFGIMPAINYLRTKNGLEVDLLVEESQNLHLFEIKSSMTVTKKHALSLYKLKKEKKINIKSANLISCSDCNSLLKDDIINYSWRNILSL